MACAIVLDADRSAFGPPQRGSRPCPPEAERRA